MNRDQSDPQPARMKPSVVVVLTDPDLAAVVEAGVSRAARSAVSLVRSLDVAEAEGAESPEVVLVVCGSGEAASILKAANALGALCMPVLEVGSSAGGPVVSPETLRLLADPGLSDLNVAVPVVAEELRALLWDSLRSARVEERHHLVEVDGRPAIEEMASRGHSLDGDDLGLLAAGAAGVLAGRFVAANRVWRPR